MKYEDRVQIVKDLLVNAFEGGSNYWYMIESPTNGDYLKTFEQDGLTVSNRKIVQDEEGEVLVSEHLMINSLLNALDLMHEKFPHHYTDAITENSDSVTGDVLLQLAMFKKVIYG